MSFQPNTWTIQPIAYDVQVPTEEAVEAGAPPQGIASIVAGMIIPISINNDGQPLIVPLVNIQVPLDKEHLQKLGELCFEKAAELPDPKPESSVLLANDMGAVEKAAEELRRFKDGGQ